MQRKNVLKNTTDAAAVLACALAFFVLFVAYNKFKPTEAAPEFLDVAQNSVYLGVIGAFLISFSINLFSRRVPFVGLAAALLPIFYLMSCFAEDMLTGKNPMLYILLALVHLAGAVIYALQWMLEGGEPKPRAISCGASAIIVTVLYFAVCALVLIDPKYGEPLFYLRGGLIFCAIAAALLGVICYRPLAGKKERAADICVTLGFALSLATLIFESI